MNKKLVAITLASTLLVGCQSMGKNETAGTAIGGLGGALVGSQFGHGDGRLLGAAIGAAAGAFVGNQVGQNIDSKE